MCKSKLSTDAIDPKKSSWRSPKKMTRASRSSSKSPGLSADPSASNNLTTSGNYTTTGSSYKDSWQSSVSSGTSLSSIRESLPENPHIFDFSEIRAATNNFLAKKLSYSSSSASWRCIIRGNDVVVIQRKFRGRINMEELRERLSSVCKSHHASLIKLRGASVSGNYIYLVYDYVHGANLADCLRNNRNPNFTVLSNWMSRIQIASDLAHGLGYAHHNTGLSSSFVHNRIKSSSIIVTEPGLNAKICHFGTAELCGEITKEPESEPGSSKFKRMDSRVMKFEGTRGYMPPEFQITGIATQKSDVYAFGVVLLELLSGEEPLKYKINDVGGGYMRTSVVETAREAVKDDGGGWLRKWMDSRLKDSYPVEVAEKMIRVGLDCVEEDPEKRPDMASVAGWISKLYLDSNTWADSMGVPLDFSSIAPR